jgi:hypothetical protein
LLHTVIADRPENSALIEVWVGRWLPRALRAIYAYADAFTGREAAALAQADVVRYLSEAGLRGGLDLR